MEHKKVRQKDMLKELNGYIIKLVDGNGNVQEFHARDFVAKVFKSVQQNSSIQYMEYYRTQK